MLSRNCDGCPHRFKCKKQFEQVDGRTERFIYCRIDGSRLLVG